MCLDLSSDLDRLTRRLDDTARRQVPYALALAINDVAFEVQKAEREHIPRVVYRPTAFTVRGVLVKKATKGKPVAKIYIRPAVAAYMAGLE